MRGVLRTVVTVLWLPAVLVLAWQLISTAVANPFYPPPGQIGFQLLELMSVEFLQRSVFPSLVLMATGFVVGSSMGVLAGALLGAHERTYAILSPIAVFLRATPTAAKLPVLLGILGIGTQTLYLAVILAVFLNVLVVTMIGVGRVNTKTIESARVIRLPGLYIAVRIRLIAATGDVLTGLQNALQAALLVTILAEILVAPYGLGAFLRDSQSKFQLTNMWVAVAIAGMIGFLSNELFHWVERRTSPWYFTTRSMENL